MRFPALASSLAALAAVVLVTYADAPGRSLATSPPSAQRFSIDMDPSSSAVKHRDVTRVEGDLRGHQRGQLPGL